MTKNATEWCVHLMVKHSVFGGYLPASGVELIDIGTLGRQNVHGYGGAVFPTLAEALRACEAFCAGRDDVDRVTITQC